MRPPLLVTSLTKSFPWKFSFPPGVIEFFPARREGVVGGDVCGPGGATGARPGPAPPRPPRQAEWGRFPAPGCR
jgi:hypothetical protein